MNYRSEIDGLRAIAVIPVILFHAGFELFGGGFVGVDIFFVISGYLITRILVEEIECKKFSIVSFYERRARRILPALYFVIIICLPFAWFWMMPSQLMDFSQSLIAVSLFGSNVLFWRESGYFAAAAEEKPLLHTWSLAVEEQYYILFPIFLLLTLRYGKKNTIWLILILAGISLFLSELGWRFKPTANFYLAPTRAWELLLGSLAAFIVLKNGIRSSNILAITGLALIVMSVVVYDKTSPFPGLLALAPVVGTFLLILYAGTGTLVCNLLSTKLLVGIGLVSYSAYLWHQPLFAFARIRLGADYNAAYMAILTSLSFLLAFLSWRFVEQPFRKRNKVSKTNVAVFTCVVVFAGILLGVFGVLQDGFRERTVLDGKTFSSYGYISAAHETIGLVEQCEGYVPIDECGFNQENEVLVWGDSFAKHGVSFIEEYEGKRVEQLTSADCPPFLAEFDIPRVGRNQAAITSCTDFNNAVASYIKSNTQLTTIVIGSRFSFLQGLSEAEIKAAAISFSDKAKMFKRHFLIKIFPPPYIPEFDISKCVDKYIRFGGNIGDCEFSPSNISEFSRKQAYFISQLNRKYFEVYPINEILCETGKCKVLVNDIRIFRDDGHFRNEGSGLLAQQLKSKEDVLPTPLWNLD